MRRDRKNKYIPCPVVIAGIKRDKAELMFIPGIRKCFL
jgi:hypothetical protein